MEVDLIVLPKESNPAISGLEIKRQVKGVFEQLYSNIQDGCFTLEMNNKKSVDYISVICENSQYVIC